MIIRKAMGRNNTADNLLKKSPATDKQLTINLHSDTIESTCQQYLTAIVKKRAVQISDVASLPWASIVGLKTNKINDSMPPIPP